MIITIDGPAGTGKTTVAKAVAEELGFTYLDTGAMYRALTYGIISQGIDPDNAEAVQAFLDAYPVTIKRHLGEKRIFLGVEDVTEKIRTNGVTSLVSKISAFKNVRDTLVEAQREFAKGVNVVVEGRDMATVVFPDAQVQVYLDADPKVRAERRYKELKEKFPDDTTTTLEGVLEDINRRDAYDASRALSPMKPSEKAVIIDTSHLSIEEVVNRIIVLKEKGETKSLYQ
jgi:CMP/dCMP kinase